MSARCGHVLDDGRECRRRVRVEGDRCHLHPWARIRPGTVVDGDVSVVVFGWDLVSVDAEGVRVRLAWAELNGLAVDDVDAAFFDRLARDLYAFHAIDDVEDVEVVEDADPLDGPRITDGAFYGDPTDDVEAFRSLSDQVEAFRSYSDQARTDAVETDEVEPWESS